MKKIIASVLVLLFVFPVVFADGSSRSEGSEEKGRPTVALVLSGGGAKGIAHIPIIEELERRGIPIDKVYGTSMGALIGGLYCAGLSPGELKDIVTGNDLMNLFTVFESTGYNEVLNAFDYNSNNVLSVSLGQGFGGISGLIDDYMIMNFITQYIGNVPDDIDFDTDLVTPFECNATNLINGDEVIFMDGSLISAMRSSMSLPLVFEPVRIDDYNVLMDGGVDSNYIVHRAVEEGYDIIIVVTLGGYRKNASTASQLESLSGVFGAALNVVMDNAARGEIEMADYWFSPDTSAYNTLSFSSATGILEKGYDEVREQKAKFDEIEALFTEDQKVYKDPDRVGEYHTKYPVRTKAEYYASKETRHEDLMGRTRLSFGLYGTVGLSFCLEKDEDDYSGKYDIQSAVLPVLSMRAFIKDLSGTPISLDFRFKIAINRTTDISVMSLFRFTPDSGNRVMGMARIKSSLGSFSFLTDRTGPAALNIFEASASFDLGLMISNERDYNLMMYFSAVNNWNIAYEDMVRRYSFVPSGSLEFVFYPNYETGYFSMTGGRIDFVCSVGYNLKLQYWQYRIALAGENTFTVSDKVALWFDGTAYCARGSASDRRTFEVYGGWDGMPGYSNSMLYAEFINGGVGVQINLSGGFASSYLAFIVRGGVRSDNRFGWYFNDLYEGRDYIPFSQCFDGIWDLGINVGYGFHTFVGDIVVGAGFNKNLQMSLFVEVS